MNTSAQAQEGLRSSFACLPLPGPRPRSRKRTVWWHYGRGEREEASCTARWLGRGYQFRLFASAGPDRVRRFASAADLLSHHAWIEQQLFAAGWHLVRFTHQADGIPPRPGAEPQNLPPCDTVVNGRLHPPGTVRIVQIKANTAQS